MGTVFCSEGFEKFFHILQEENITIQELDERLPKAISLIAREGYLGKVDVYMKAPASVYEPDGVDYKKCLYCNEDGYDAEPYEERFVTGENGTVSIIFYPEKRHMWTEEELGRIRFLAQNIYVLSGRIRLMGLVKRANVTENLTGAANLNGLMRFGEMLQGKGQISRYNGSFMNIKNFKYINQRLGNRRGDYVLREYCHKIQKFLNEDEIIARLGGDNFVVLFKKEHEKDFLDFMSDVKIHVENEGDIIVETRMGIYSAGDGDTIGDIMNGSTTALNVAKQNINNDRVWFEPHMMEREMRDKMVAGLFAQAIKTREFVVYYQPKVSLVNSQLCGCEALVRWKRDGKLVPPMDFIPVLERDGTICELDFYVFDSVCQDIKRWCSQGIEPVKVSVNFSKVHVFDWLFTKRILSILQKYGVDSKYIEIELTESSSQADYRDLMEFITSMRDCGINVSIDDFGTGYSSLSLLKELKVDIIKLDKSFIDNLEKQNGTDEIVIKNIINMVNELDMQVIAEGVETSGQAEFLRKANCAMAQGYLFDRPLPCEEFEMRLTEGREYISRLK
ncbi:MAG: EAL domain-containing protein [Lachnospiraceae bacterium]|nr:EAL domain-containing protein [Lachnospiraceae bacterium]